MYDQIDVNFSTFKQFFWPNHSFLKKGIAENH